MLGDIKAGEVQERSQGKPAPVHVCLGFDNGNTLTLDRAVRSEGPANFSETRELPLPGQEITKDEPRVMPCVGIRGSRVP